jgi:NAD(P)-dependent dehydrogenase (short-subunit alcohol dehydrogenase family)
MIEKTAIVTGSGQGIGRAIAEDLAKRGFALVLAERDPARGSEVAQAIEAAGGKAICTPTDITDPAAVNAMAEQALQHFGRIDVLVNNARWTGLQPTPITEITDEVWARTIGVNLTGAFHCVRAVVPAMKAQGAGRIVMMSSSTFTSPPAQPYVHYITTKAGLVGMARALAKELGPHRITVNCVLPGAIETGVERPHLSTDERIARAARTQAIPELINANDLTGAVAFLVSDDARFITGHSLTVDGGRTFL